MPLTNQQILTTIASIKAQLDALAIAVSGNFVPDASNAALNDTVTIKDIQGQTITVDKALTKGMVLRLANTRSVNVTSSGTQVTIDQPVGNGVLPGSVAVVTKVPGVTAPDPTPAPTPDPVPTPSPAPAAPITGIPLLGINLAAHSNANQVLPGEAGTHFKWPSRADVTLYVKTLGVRLIRFPYALQRATLIDSTGLPVKGGQLDPTFVAKLKQVLGWIREDSNGEALVIFDPHTYWRMYRNQTSGGKQTGALLPANEAAGQGGRWKRQEQILIDDENGWGAADLGDHIASMATTFDSPMILGYGAGNEPYADGMSVAAMEAKVVSDLNVMLPIIRKVTSKPVFICGMQWASARNFAQVSSTFAAGIKDPANNWIPEVHGYGDLDGGSSGKYNSGNLNAFPVDQISNVFRPAYSYMATKGLRCFVGETGIPPTDSARQSLARALDEAKANGVPVTLWIAGGDGAMGGEKMNLDDVGHAATRDMIKARAGERIAEWKAVKA